MPNLWDTRVSVFKAKSPPGDETWVRTHCMLDGLNRAW
jgi:hypothetical protein